MFLHGLFLKYKGTLFGFVLPKQINIPYVVTSLIL